MKVRVAPLQPHCFAFGGFEVQMISALEAAREMGTDIERLDPWNRDSDFDTYHMWGCDICHLNTARWALLANKKLVMSALFPYPNTRTLLRYWASLIVGTSWHRKPLLSWLSALTVVNKMQANYAVGTLGFPRERVFVIPNIVEEIFFDRSFDGVQNGVTLKGYIICTGNICQRKNQLQLIKACQKIGVPLLLVGNTLTGEEAYGHAVEEAMRGVDNMQWIRGLPANSQELASVYHNSIGFALPSLNEQQPISALEAAAAGKPLLLANRDYAKQEFYNNSALVNPNSVSDIARNLRSLLDNPEKFTISPGMLDTCRRKSVGSLYIDAYRAPIR